MHNWKNKIKLRVLHFPADEMYSGESALEMNTGTSQKLEEKWVGKEAEKEKNKNEITEKKKLGILQQWNAKKGTLSGKYMKWGKLKSCKDEIKLKKAILFFEKTRS